MSELSGIVRNAFERGWPIEEIKSSLVNSGYSVQEIDYEIAQVTSAKSSLQVSTVPSTNPQTAIQQNKFDPQNLSNYQTPSVEKKAGNGMIIAIIILLLLCVLGGLGFYLFA